MFSFVPDYHTNSDWQRAPRFSRPSQPYPYPSPNQARDRYLAALAEARNAQAEYDAALAAEERRRLAEERRRLAEEDALRAYYSGDGHHPYLSHDPTELYGYSPYDRLRMEEANRRAAEQRRQRQKALELEDYLKSADAVRPSSFDLPFNYPQQRREVCTVRDHLLSSVSDVCLIHSPSLFAILLMSTHIILSPNTNARYVHLSFILSSRPSSNLYLQPSIPRQQPFHQKPNITPSPSLKSKLEGRLQNEQDPEVRDALQSILGSVLGTVPSSIPVTIPITDSKPTAIRKERSRSPQPQVNTVASSRYRIILFKFLAQATQRTASPPRTHTQTPTQAHAQPQPQPQRPTTPPTPISPLSILLTTSFLLSLTSFTPALSTASSAFNNSFSACA